MRRLMFVWALVVGVATSAPLAADEGKWMPQQIPVLAERLVALGFAGDPAAFADLLGHPMGAIVSLGGCTGSFVSPDGLIATNHHCVTGSLQYNSTPERNLLRDGFLAKTRAEEVSTGPGSRVFVTVSFTNVTEAITGGLDPSLDDRARIEAIDGRVKARTTACEADGRRCRVASFFEGLEYYEMAQLEISDVRLVYAPADGIGNFGGETDNWRWPRHTGDWAFYRAYVAPDGTPAPFAEANVPYAPSRWLKVQPSGVQEGDLVFVAGYPGRTDRLQTLAEVKEAVEWSFPRTIRTFRDQIAILEALAEGDEALRIKVTGRLQGLNNTLTNRQGMIEGLVRGGLLDRKADAERALVEWMAADEARAAAYGDVMPAMAAAHAEAIATRERDAILASLFSASPVLAAAHTAYRLAIEKGKPDDADREAGFQQRDWGRLRDAQERAQRAIDLRIDRALLGYWMREAAALPADLRIAPLDALAGLNPGMEESVRDAAIDAFLSRLLEGTTLADKDVRLALFDRTPDELRKMDDPVIVLALALESLQAEVRDEAQRRRGVASRLRPRYAQALIDQAGGLVAPDANSTLRVTYGQVKARPNAVDGLDYRAFTTLAGIEQKHTGEGEFNAPAALLSAIRALRAGRTSRFVAPGLGDVPVNFLSTVDITGGNSGSPTLDARGDFVGLVFDGTYDTVASDYVFDPVRTRAIHADVRYLLWALDEVEGAEALLAELGVTRAGTD